MLISVAPPCGSDGIEQGSGSPAGVVFMLGSPEFGHTPPHSTRPRRFSGDTSIILLYEIQTHVFAHLRVIVSVRLTMHFQFTSSVVKWALPAQPALAGPTVICTRPTVHLRACAMVTQMPLQQTSVRTWHLCHLNCQRRRLWR